MGQDPNEIRREIAEIRDRMSQTIDAIEYKTDVPSRVRDSLTQRVETVKETLNNAVGVASDRAKAASETVLTQLASARENAGSMDVTETARQTAKGAAASARSAAMLAAQNPIGLALAALAVGFLAGLLVPMSDLERERAEDFGEVLGEQARTVAHDAADAVIGVVVES